MMFLVMAVVFALRMSFPIVLTQMVYVPNPDTNNNSTKEIVCPIKSHMIENTTSHDPISTQSVPLMVIYNN